MADNLYEQPFGNEVLTTGHLFDELVAIANINQSFRQGRQDFMHIVTDTSDTPSLDAARVGNETDESVVARLIDPDMGDINWPEPIYGNRFELQAKRKFECTVDERDNTSVQQHLFLTYVMTVTTMNIPLPGPVATDAYGLSNVDEAVENGGNSQHDHVKTISIDSKDFKPLVCEAMVFYDSNSDSVSMSHTCQDPRCQFDEPAAGEQGEHTVIQADSTSLLKIYEDLAEANGDNSPETTEIETKKDDILSQFDWDGFVSSMLIDEKEQLQRDLELAFEVLESLKKALRNELGMNIRPTFPRQQDKI